MSRISAVRWFLATSLLLIIFSLSCTKPQPPQPLLASKVTKGEVVKKDGWWLNDTTFKMLYEFYRKHHPKPE